MKRLLLLIVSGLTAIAAQADEKSTAVLSALQREVEGWGAYRVDISATAEDRTFDGYFVVSGDRYVMSTPDTKVISDATTDRIIDPEQRTVVIMESEKSNNPARLFDFMSGSYSHKFIGAAIINGVDCDRLELTDAETGDRLEVYLAEKNHRPVRLIWKMGGSTATIDVRKISTHISLPVDTFTLPTEYSDYEVIDFR